LKILICVIGMRIEEEIRQKKFVNNHQKANLNILFTANWVIGTIKETLKPFGITHQQFNVLRILKGKQPESCSADEIKRVMLDKSPDLTRLIDRLVDKGYVTRVVNTKNRRKLDIAIKDQGSALLEEIGPEVKKEMVRLKGITDKEARELSRILDKMRS